MRHADQIVGYRLHVSPIDGLLVGVGFAIAWQGVAALARLVLSGA